MISFLISSTICLSVLLLFYHFVLRKESMFVFNRFFLLGSLVFSLMIPLINLPPIFPTLNSSSQNAGVEIQQAFLKTVIQPSDEKNPVIAPNSVQPKHEKQVLDWSWFLVSVYLVGLVFFIMRFIFQIFSLSGLVKKGAVIQKERYRLVLIGLETMPFTFLDYLFVNEITYLTDGLEQEILQHELTHIKEKHSIDILFVEALKIIFWFNPIFLFYKKAIQLNHEFLADREVVACSDDVLPYQKLLISKVLGKEFVYNLSSPINYSVTKNRLIMMKKSTSKQKSFLLRISLIPLFGFLLGSFSQTTASQSNNLFSQGYPVKDFESYIQEALSEESDFVVALEKLDIEGAKTAYLKLTEDEKAKVTEFPILEDGALTYLIGLQNAKDSIKVKINFSPPPKKMSISDEVWTNWIKSKNVELIVDDKKEDISNLSNFSQNDFALFEVRGIEKKKFLKPEKYQLTLTTHDHFENKFVTSRKKIQTISASYPNGDIAEIPYFMKYVLMNQKGELEEYFPENYLQRALEAILTQEFKDLPSANAIMDIRKSFWINVTRNGQKEMVVVSYN
ncbi:M56 family metallopeptidase [Aquiflexum gelatinilyticum]|uniref:M56 family metallopeptidase n=1 Tax=Aquiflexum gelatinilyticum TaxID=2961943 RepID=UPI002168B56E|nr:M56 family metallopeptidase [Aquiflexum gelatinilyticum]MCS4433198.1 M56 family metallopeptidase [Aquiflexum gelatinilyticum]